MNDTSRKDIQDVKSAIKDLHSDLLYYSCPSSEDDEQKIVDRPSRFISYGITVIPCLVMISMVLFKAGVLLADVIFAYVNGVNSALQYPYDEKIMAALLISMFVMASLAATTDSWRWPRVLMIKWKLRSSRWTVKDVQDALVRQDFAHPSLQVFIKDPTAFEPLNGQQLAYYHGIFSSLPKDHSCRFFWEKFLTKSQDCSIRHHDVRRLTKLLDLQEKLIEMKNSTPQGSPDILSVQFELRQQLKRGFEDPSSPIVEVDPPRVERCPPSPNHLRL